MKPTKPESTTPPNGFSDTQNAVLALLGNTLCEAHLSIPEKVDWHAVLDEMIAQAVFAMPRDSLPDSVHADVKSDWEKLCLRNVATTIQVLSEQSNATKLLSANDPSIVVLKGAAAAIYYPDPTLRCMGDIDLISLDGNMTTCATRYKRANTSGLEGAENPTTSTLKTAYYLSRTASSPHVQNRTGQFGR